MKTISALTLLICLIMYSCKTKEVATPKEHEGNQLILTHGGGFAGKYKTYCLLDNGQLFKSTNQFEATNPVKSLDRKTVDQIFSNYDVLGLGSENLQAYGNLNYSIRMISKDGEEHKLSWDKGQEGAEKLQLFYRNIMNEIRIKNSDNTSEGKSKAVK